MSGVEAIGLALGLLPLLISAIEHYDDIIRPISRYRNFASKAGRFLDELETQRTIFRTECQLLLAIAAGPEVAANMLLDHRHSLWNDMAISRRLTDQLGSLSPTCKSLVSKIDGKLRDIGQKCEQFGAAIAQANSVSV